MIDGELIEEAIFCWGRGCYVSRVYGRWKRWRLDYWKTAEGPIRVRIEAWWFASAFEIF